MPWTRLAADPQKCNDLRTESKEGAGRVLSYSEAITEAIQQSMEMDPRVLILGEGIDAAGYLYGTTAGLSQRYGVRRVIETPIAEAAMTGITAGAAVAGLRPIIMHMRNDFILVSADQIVNHIAHWNELFPCPSGMPVVIRAIVARGWGSGAQHSQSFHSMFAGLDGLDVVMPATPYDVKGMFLQAVASERPVLFLEHRWLYGDKGGVPAEPYLLPLDKAVVRKIGQDITIIGMSLTNRDVNMAVDVLAKEYGISAEWIDLRSIQPLDLSTIAISVKKTGRLLVMENGPVKMGCGAEISAKITELCWNELKKPVSRIGWKGSTVPSGSKMEAAFYPGAEEIVKQARKMMEV
ncbi:alpha-ketoacid dehydrogenase subunit beta [Anaeroarcus burkinensis]|uniref:alpha-ketoacid dehydrogenase subunit beta n=1 Tax=Anaeroarcus burkinensis TaxID=82376 RepID=UPI000400C7DE|nr:transketolase C-terminal domain-containing protein [Anaeroarcus burkinensis]